MLLGARCVDAYRGVAGQLLLECCNQSIEDPEIRAGRQQVLGDRRRRSGMRWRKQAANFVFFSSYSAAGVTFLWRA